MFYYPNTIERVTPNIRVLTVSTLLGLDTYSGKLGHWTNSRLNI